MNENPKEVISDAVIQAVARVFVKDMIARPIEDTKRIIDELAARKDYRLLKAIDDYMHSSDVNLTD